MEPDRWSNRKRAAVVLVAIALIVASGWFAWELLRPRTIREVMEADRLQPGSTVELEGTITAIYRENSSYGPRVNLELDHYDVCGGPNGGHVLGDPAVDYRIGDRFRTTLHFVPYRFNGDPAVWAPELVCPFPGLPRAFGYVWDAVSLITGFALVYQGTDPGGWSAYEVATPQGDRFRADALPATLRRSPPVLADAPQLRARASINSAGAWIVIMAYQYLLTSGQFGAAPAIDDMASLAAGASRNGTMRFVDSDGDGLVGDGDRLEVHLPDTGGGTSYDTYMLQVGEANGTMAAYAYAGHYLLHGPTGPFESLPIPLAELAHLRHVGDQVGAKVTSTIEVARVRLGTPQPTASLRFGISVNGSEFSGDLAGLPAVLGNGVALSFVDRNGTGVFDTGDGFVLGGLDNRTDVSFRVSDGGSTLATATWITGYGHVVGARFPQFALVARGPDPYRVDADVPFWHPELALNRTARASLRENSVPVLNDIALRTGTIGSFANGTLNFTDADGDGSLSSGDFFTVDGSPAARYDLEVSVLFGDVRRSVLFGP